MSQNPYKFTQGRINVHYLNAPYGLLVKAFANDGTTASRDELKQLCQWDVKTPDGLVEVYDYLVGEGCGGSLQRHEINAWHVQGAPGAIQQMLGMLDAAAAQEA